MTTEHNFGPVGIIGSTVADKPDPRLLPLGAWRRASDDSVAVVHAGIYREYK